MIAEVLAVAALVAVVMTAPTVARRARRNTPDRAWRASGFHYTSDTSTPPPPRRSGRARRR